MWGRGSRNGPSRTRGPGFAALVMAGALLGVGASAGLLWFLEPKPFRIVFPPAAPLTDGWAPLFEPSESDGVEAVAGAEDQFGPQTLVLAVSIGNESRAYPLTVIGGQAQYKVVNDTIGGQAIAVTFWDLCRQGIVYARSLDERKLTLGVSGHLLESRYMIMYDVETGSSWNQSSGFALEGSLVGKRLRAVPSVVMEWATWRAQHPEGTVVMSVRRLGA